MSLTLADIDRWDPEAIRNVASALSKRGASAGEVEAGLARLPLIASWQGTGGDAARQSLDKLSAYLADHKDEMAALAKAIEAEAAEVKIVKDELADADETARQQHFHIDRITGEVIPLDQSRLDDPQYAAEQKSLLDKLWHVLRDAYNADVTLAQAITGSTAHLQAPVEYPPPPTVPRHPSYPNRAINGGYGQGNSGDGKVQETQALDKWEEETNIPVIRQQIVATHPDVERRNGKPQRRLYDGLQPTGRPGEYIGLEAKQIGKGRNVDQTSFDSNVSPRSPATAILNGQQITIVGTRVIYPPEQVGPTVGPGLASTQGTASGQANSAGIPDSILHWTPGGGTSITPQQLDELYPGASQYLPQQRPPTA